MDTVYPSAASALERGRRLRRHEPRARHRTMPVTFAEIKEVDEESEAEAPAVEGGEERRRRPDMLEDRLGRQFAEFRRRRRARPPALRELSPAGPAPPVPPAPPAPPLVRCASLPEPDPSPP